MSIRTKLKSSYEKRQEKKIFLVIKNFKQEDVNGIDNHNNSNQQNHLNHSNNLLNSTATAVEPDNELNNINDRLNLNNNIKPRDNLEKNKSFVIRDKKLSVNKQTYKLREEFKCSYAKCFKVYKNKENLELHIKTKHLKIKPFTCSYCDSKFSHRNGNL